MIFVLFFFSTLFITCRACEIVYVWCGYWLKIWSLGIFYFQEIWCSWNSCTFRNMISLTFSSYKSRKGILHFSSPIIKTLGYIDATIGKKEKIFLFFQIFLGQSWKISLIKLFSMIPHNHTFTPINGLHAFWEWLV
jgi:hypothetical protein